MFSVFSNKGVSYKADRYLVVLWWVLFLVLHDHVSKDFSFLLYPHLFSVVFLARFCRMKEKSVYCCLDCAVAGLNHAEKTPGTPPFQRGISLLQVLVMVCMACK